MSRLKISIDLNGLGVFRRLEKTPRPLNYIDAEIARTYKLSKASFSRFAGSRWDLDAGTVPDLWRNTAKVLSEHELFKDIALKAGVWDMVKATLEKTENRKQ